MLGRASFPKILVDKTQVFSLNPVLDSPIMSSGTSRIKFLWVAALVFSTLACQAATQLILPATPTPLPTGTPTNPPTATPTPLPTFTPTVVFEAACPSLIEKVLDTVTAVIHLDKRSDEVFKGEGTIYLVDYEVDKDGIQGPHIESVPEELEDERDDRASHEAIWNYFASIIPLKEREFVSEFSIFTDGLGNHLAAVSPLFSDPEQWVLYVDILDAASYYDLTYTLIHEQGHLLTLNAEQVTPSTALLKFPDNKTVYQQEEAACSQYFTGEGCSTPDSYINQFFTRFWPSIYEEWTKIDAEEDETTRATLLDEFYKTNRDQFVSEYASTSPTEDIAESWAFFVLSPKPELNSIANEKILFFYEYPELVELRAKILTQICVEFPQ